MRLGVGRAGAGLASGRPQGSSPGHARVAGGGAPVSVRSYAAHYCVPHIKVPGLVKLWPAEKPERVIFEPDARDAHVREFGAEQYKLRVEARDIIECGAVEMPLEEEGSTDPGAVHFLQLQVRTLDGCEYCSVEEAQNSPLFVTFRLGRRQELFELARTLLEVVPPAGEAMEQLAKAASSGVRSTTRVPYACLDSLAEAEAASHHRQLQAALRQPAVAPEAVDDGFQRQGSSPSTASSGPRYFEKVVLKTSHIEDWSGQTLLTKPLAESLLESLPISLRVPGAVEWVLRYTPKAHGVSMETLYRNMADHEKSVLLVQDAEDELFGGFASCAWVPHNLFYGSGEAFLFSFGRVARRTGSRGLIDVGAEPARKGRRAREEKLPQVTTWTWSAKNSFIQYSDHTLLGMGGGNGKHAFAIREDLLHGLSNPTETFGNPTLSTSEDFIVRDIEIWALEEVGVE